MGNIWQPKDSRKFAKWVRQQGKGTTVYTVEAIEQHVAPYEDAGLYSTHTFTHENPFTGNLLAGHMSAESLCAGFGPVYEQPPAGIRHMATPGPQVAGPVDPNEIHQLDEAELRSLEKRAIEIEQGRREAAARAQRKKFSLFH